MIESQLKSLVADELTQLGFEVYLDKADIQNPKAYHYFHGDQAKPDLIVYSTTVKPFGIELKDGKGFGRSVVAPIKEQMMRYQTEQERSYSIGNKEVKLDKIFLGTTPSIKENRIYTGSRTFPHTRNEDAQKAINWAALRFAYNGTGGHYGFLKKNQDGYYLETPNYILKLQPNGSIRRVQHPDWKPDINER